MESIFERNKKYIWAVIVALVVIGGTRIGIDLYNVNPPDRDITGQMRRVMGNAAAVDKIAFDKETKDFLMNNKPTKIEPTDAQGLVVAQKGSIIYVYGLVINGHAFTAFIKSDSRGSLRKKIFPKRSVVQMSTDKNASKIDEWLNKK
ncbi:hypothetical protein EQG49_03455 [Periweissella cryptocerci]|uniref:Uncharacterized protein n=1 Tax=Periweissella cryptocerci TaxID=2506420 RepID=A0A4P6YSG3_9LACO|nr:hypothetical protein [Periweissella cryptocerci]QBO35580.1 hypothetical protein EQG49_03455 [Periweissella cryptocerci]